MDFNFIYSINHKITYVSLSLFLIQYICVKAFEMSSLFAIRAARIITVF